MARTSCVPKVPYILSSYSKNTRALTFENVCQVCVNMPSDFWVKTGQVLTPVPTRQSHIPQVRFHGSLSHLHCVIPTLGKRQRRRCR